MGNCTIPKLIIFNGPPRSGKDTCADMTTQYFEYLGLHVDRYSLATPVKLTAHAIYGAYGGICDYEQNKDLPTDEFDGQSPRQAYIKVSEDIVKPVLGNDWWVKLLIKRINREAPDIAVLSDCGFDEEYKTLVSEYSCDNVIVVKLVRGGTSFKNDSRKYLDIVANKVIYNNGTLNELHNTLIHWLNGFIEGK